MLKVSFFQKPETGSIHMVMKGHSGVAPSGQDLPCAGATMLAYTVAQVVNFMHSQGKLTRKPKVVIHHGKAVIVATPATDDAYAECLYAFWFAQCGMDVLQKNYPKNVKLVRL